MTSVLGSLKISIQYLGKYCAVHSNSQFYSKSSSFWLLFPNPILMVKFTKEKFCQVFDFWGVSVLQTWVWGWGFWEQFHWAATFCLQHTSSLDKEKRQWDKCQMASSVTPYRMPLIVAWKRPFTSTSRGKTGVSWLQERRERCADAVNKIRPRACKQLWRQNGTTTRHEIFPESLAQLK